VAYFITSASSVTGEKETRLEEDKSDFKQSPSDFNNAHAPHLLLIHKRSMILHASNKYSKL